MAAMADARVEAAHAETEQASARASAVAARAESLASQALQAVAAIEAAYKVNAASLHDAMAKATDENAEALAKAELFEAFASKC